MFLPNLNGKQHFMGAIKANNYNTLELELAKFGSAISHPFRVHLITRLVEDDSFRNCDISREYSLSRSTINSHIRKLQDADLIKIDYFMHFYSISIEPSKKVFLKIIVNSFQ